MGWGLGLEDFFLEAGENFLHFGGNEIVGEILVGNINERDREGSQVRDILDHFFQLEPIESVCFADPSSHQNAVHSVAASFLGDGD